MQETPQEYTQRMLKNVAERDPLRVQQATPKKIERLIRRLNRRQLQWRPAPDKWSIAEIVAHLSETELVGGYRIRTILSANRTSIQAFDQDAWARNGNYAARDPQRSLALFRALREANLALLKSLPQEKWQNYGMHAERGKETIAHVVKMFAGHDINHLQQIERLARDGRTLAGKSKASR